MKAKKSLNLIVGLLLVVAFLGSVMVQTVAAEEKATEKKVEYLYVQTAHAVSFKGNALTLHGVNDSTLYFSDRPDRIAGHGTTEELVKEWTVGEDSFAKSPPNATLSILQSGDEEIENLVVVLQNPQLKGADLTYDIKVLDGKIPAHGGANALFIDVIGRPLSPVSVAGVARRQVRREVVRR